MFRIGTGVVVVVNENEWYTDGTVVFEPLKSIYQQLMWVDPFKKP